MRKFSYVITRPTGIDAHLASRLVTIASAMDSTIAIHRVGGGAAAVATNFTALAGMGLRQGDTVEVTVGFGNEEANTVIMEQFFANNL